MGSIASHNLLLFGFPSCLDFAATAAAATLLVIVVLVVVMRFLGLFRFCLFCGR